VSLGTTAGNQRGVSWLMLEYLPTASLAAIRRQVSGCLLSRRALLVPHRKELPCSAESETTCSQRWPWTASPKERSVVFSSYWITLMPGAERISAFYKWRKK